MKPFESYVGTLETLVSKFLNLDIINDQDYLMMENALNGQPSKVLRSLIPLSELRQSGIFFTNRHLADQLMKLIASDIEKVKTIYDPACGVGDLLLACARRFPILEDLETTLEDWSRRLKGADLYQQFIEATKVRLLFVVTPRNWTPGKVKARRYTRTKKGYTMTMVVPKVYTAIRTTTPTIDNNIWQHTANKNTSM